MTIWVERDSLSFKRWRNYTMWIARAESEPRRDHAMAYRYDDRWKQNDAGIQRRCSGPDPCPGQVDPPTERDHRRARAGNAAGGCRTDADGHGQSDARRGSRVRFHDPAIGDPAGEFPVGRTPAADDLQSARTCNGGLIPGAGCRQPARYLSRYPCREPWQGLPGTAASIQMGGVFCVSPFYIGRETNEFRAAGGRPLRGAFRTLVEH